MSRSDLATRCRQVFLAKIKKYNDAGQIWAHYVYFETHNKKYVIEIYWLSGQWQWGVHELEEA